MPLSKSETVLLLSRLSVHSLCSFHWSLWVCRLQMVRCACPTSFAKVLLHPSHMLLVLDPLFDIPYGWWVHRKHVTHPKCGVDPSGSCGDWIRQKAPDTYRCCQSSPGEVQVILVCAPIDMSYPQEHHQLVKRVVHQACHRRVSHPPLLYIAVQDQESGSSVMWPVLCDRSSHVRWIRVRRMMSQH